MLSNIIKILLDMYKIFCLFFQVIHDCRNDSVNLYNQFGITLRCVFDTQAAHAVLLLQETQKPVYKAKNVSLNALCEIYNSPINPMKEQLKNIYRRDQRLVCFTILCFLLSLWGKIKWKSQNCYKCFILMTKKKL